ncbi:MAG: ribosomal protein S18-alanine N-acetyltransferase [Clostridia bacterium]|nr:ribosomal protein S18-alanine N-acetyltransferase [Clostridia bacterium]MEE1023853.1 ribosomal protein S18-alanine N-acetyltransferase [Acutalibacteraceae bacterium]
MMTVKRLTEKDVANIAALETECFSHPWSEKTVTEHIINPNNGFFGAFVDGVIVGYGGVCTVLDEAYITNICTSKSHRRCGAANEILSEIERFCKSKNCSFISLEVRKSNTAAIKLYESHAFSAVGLRKKFYSAPDEDALIYTKRF